MQIDEDEPVTVTETSPYVSHTQPFTQDGAKKIDQMRTHRQPTISSFVEPPGAARNFTIANLNCGEGRASKNQTLLSAMTGTGLDKIQVRTG